MTSPTITHLMSRLCPVCRKVYKPDILVQDGEAKFDQDWKDWRNGELAQNVWPNATASQREQIQTSICSDECRDAFEKYRVDDRGGSDRHDESVG